MRRLCCALRRMPRTLRMAYVGAVMALSYVMSSGAPSAAQVESPQSVLHDIVDRMAHDAYWSMTSPIPASYRPGERASAAVISSEEFKGVCLPALNACKLFRVDQNGILSLLVRADIETDAPLIECAVRFLLKTLSTLSDETVASVRYTEGPVERRQSIIAGDIMGQGFSVALEQADGLLKPVLEAACSGAPAPDAPSDLCDNIGVLPEELRLVVSLVALPAIGLPKPIAQRIRPESAEQILKMLRETQRELGSSSGNGQICAHIRFLVPYFSDTDSEVFVLEERDGCLPSVLILELDNSGGWVIAGAVSNARAVEFYDRRIREALMITVDRE
jgi:hypothetical protein